MICSGREGLECVADGGIWDWIFVGPDPIKLPLVAGGCGGLEEMRECYDTFIQDDDHANLYGLIRMDFANETKQRTKYVFIRASRFDDNSNISIVKQGQLTSLKGAMQKSCLEYTHFTVVLEFTALEDFSHDIIFDKLHKASQGDRDIITEEGYEVGREQFLERLRQSKEQGTAFTSRHRPTIRKRPSQSLSPRPSSGNATRETIMPAIQGNAIFQMAAEAAGISPEAHPSYKQETACQVEMPPEEEQSPEPADEGHGEAVAAKMPSEGTAVAKEATGKASSEGAPADGDQAEGGAATDSPAPQAEGGAAVDAAEGTDAPVDGVEGGDSAEGKRDSSKPAQEAPLDFQIAELVTVYCPSRKRWFDDATIIKRLAEPGFHDSMQLKAGSVKVHYNEKKTFTWLLPAHFKEYLKKSFRPRPPASGNGQLYKQTHGLFSKKHIRYFDLSDGYLQWWPDEEDCNKGYKSNGEIYLEELELKSEGTKFWIRSKSSKGVIYAFDATTEDGCEAWCSGLSRHGKYCDVLAEYKASLDAAGGAAPDIVR